MRSLFSTTSPSIKGMYQCYTYLLCAVQASEVSEVKQFGFMSGIATLSGELNDLDDSTFEVCMHVLTHVHANKHRKNDA